MFRLICALILITSTSKGFAFGQEDRFPAAERTSLSDLIPNYDDLRVETKCEGQSLKCSKFSDAKTCLKEGRDLGCFWSYK